MAGNGLLIGRERELGALRAAVADVGRGSGRLVWIAGEPGIGKTRLAEQVAAEARAAGINEVWGRCWGEPGAPELWPWVQVLRTCLRRVDDGALRRLVGPHSSELTALVAAPDDSMSADPAAPARFRLFNAIAHFLDQYSRLAPLLIVLEDLHLADAQSLLLLQFFAQEQRERPILLLATFREPGGPSHPALTRAVLETMREPGSQRLDLEGFDEAEVRSCVSAARGVEPDADTAAALRRATGGNPLFLGECLRQMAHAQFAGKVLAASDIESLDLSPPLAALIDQRLELLTREQCMVLVLAAAVGDEFCVDDLRAHAAQMDVRTEADLDWDAGVRAAVMSGLLYRCHEQRRYRFVQSLVRRFLSAPGSSAPRRGLVGRNGESAVLGVPANAAIESAAPAVTFDAAVFRKEGEYWTVTFGGRTCRMADIKGLAYIGLLLRHPGTALHVSEIVRLGRSEAAAGAAPSRDDSAAPSVRVGLGDSGVLLDRQAKEDYRHRLDALQRELEEANSCNDSGRADRARREIEFVTDELTAAVGLGGRDRRAGSDVERARVNVTRSIARAIQRLDSVHPELAQHLTRTIRTGTFCCYIAEPAVTRTWDL